MIRVSLDRDQVRQAAGLAAPAWWDQQCSACGEPWRFHPAFAPWVPACKAALDAAAEAERTHASIIPTPTPEGAADAEG